MNYTISRIPYLVIGFIAQVTAVGLIYESQELLRVLGIAIMLLFPLILAVPRARDCGWPPWLGLLTLIPFLGLVPAVALAFGPTRMGILEGNEEASAEEDPEGPS